jgi:hypothetical protein
MGDRTDMNVTVNEKHFYVLEEIDNSYETFDGGPAVDGEIVTLHYAEMNYGGCALLDALQERGVPFYGDHGDGGEYGAMRFAFDGNKYGEWYEDAHNGYLTVPVLEDGEVEAESLHAVREFLALEKRAMEKVGKRL